MGLAPICLFISLSLSLCAIVAKLMLLAKLTAKGTPSTSSCGTIETFNLIMRRYLNLLVLSGSESGRVGRKTSLHESFINYRAESHREQDAL